jgi:recombination protein RecA
MNTEGISIFGGLVDLAVQHGLITKAGAFFKVGDQNIQGREGAKKFFKENPKIAKEYRDKIWDKIKNTTQSTEIPKNTEDSVDEE